MPGVTQSVPPIPRDDPKRIAVPPPSAEETMFRHYGEYWRIVYSGKSLSFGSTKGLFYIGYLLHHPEERVHSCELVKLTENASASESLGNGFDDGDATMERVRKAVTNRIRDCVLRIGKQHPTLGRHLSNTLQTGSYCWYRPERKIAWT